MRAPRQFLASLLALSCFTPLDTQARFHIRFDDPEILLRPPRSNDEFFFRDSGLARRTFRGDAFDPANWCWRNRKADLVVELEELQAVLAEAGVRGDNQLRALDAYRDLRSGDKHEHVKPEQLKPHQRLHDDFATARRWALKFQLNRFLGDHPAGTAVDLERIPAEFMLYAKGAQHYWKGETEQARKAWSRLLDLPKGQRRYRTVWATWMLGKCEADEDRARAWFEKTLTLSRDPAFQDSLRLADLARGWLLQTEPPGPNQMAALHTQWDRALRGSERAFSILSRIQGRWILGRMDEEERAAHRKDPVARLVLLDPRTNNFPRKLPRLDDGKPPRHVPPARENPYRDFLDAYLARPDLQPGERTDLATACYAEGRFDDARSLLEAETNPHPQTHWLRGKVAAWNGDFPQALKHLEATRNHFLKRSPHAGWFADWNEEVIPRLGWYGMDTILYLRRLQFWQDLGILRLTNNNFEGALAAFVEGDVRPWAAYVMHHVMTTEELARFVDRDYPNTAIPESSKATFSLDVFTGYRGWRELRAYENPVANFVRHAFARRLVAEGHYERAAGYFGKKYRPPAMVLAELVSQGRNEKISKRERAQALWSAARVHYSHSCYFGVTRPFAHRLPPEQWPAYWRLGTRFPACLGKPNRPPPAAYPPPSAEELERQRTVNWPGDFRGHPWFDAGELAWEAAALLPANDELAATILCHAGCWIMHQHPLKADRFYKALARRHPKTDLGKQAVTKRWFPLSQSRANPYHSKEFAKFAKSAGLSETRPGPRWPFQYDHEWRW